MKRFLAILICLLILISFTACAGAKNKEQKIDELNKAIASQSLVASGEKLAFDINGGKWLMSGVKNETAEDIEVSELVIAFLAWDKEGNPILIKSASGNTEDSYIKEVNLGSTPILPGFEWVSETEDSVTGFRVDSSQTEITYAEAIVISFTDDDGNERSNPYYDIWKVFYEGKERVNKEAQ